jgi:hypothetical protein
MHGVVVSGMVFSVRECRVRRGAGDFRRLAAFIGPRTHAWLVEPALTSR